VTGATIVWFRQDLRLRDNPALHAAVATGTPVIPVYIWSPEEEGDWAPGAASRWWLHHSLAALDQDLRERGSRLILAHGRAADVLKKLAANTGATAVHWNRRYEPDAAPYFRIFNPETQAERFDPDNRYIDAWVPKEGCAKPVVDLKQTREAALDAYVTMRRAASQATSLDARGGNRGWR
jgi:deoxyribodipyrimidine photolyase